MVGVREIPWVTTRATCILVFVLREKGLFGRLVVESREEVSGVDRTSVFSIEVPGARVLWAKVTPKGHVGRSRASVAAQIDSGIERQIMWSRSAFVRAVGGGKGRMGGN